MKKLHNIGLAKMQTESRTFGRTISDGKWPQFTEKAERPVKSHHFGRPSFAALTVQLCGDQPNKLIPAKRLSSQKMGEGSAAGCQLGIDSVREHPASR
jgi:hypothetical protein